MPERGRDGRGRPSNQCTLIVIWNGAYAFWQGCIDLIEARVCALNHIRRVRTIEFKNEAGDRLAIAVGSREPLARTTANNDLSKIAHSDRTTVDRANRRFCEVGNRSCQADTTHGVLFRAYFDELRTGRAICAF